MLRIHFIPFIVSFKPDTKTQSIIKKSAHLNIPNNDPLWFKKHCIEFSNVVPLVI